jgi:phosphopantetheinyl transferase
MVYTAAELKWMEEDPLERFHLLWTMKESVMKATGLGMNLGPDSFEVLPFCFNSPVMLRGRTWYASYGALGDYRCSVCASYPMEAVLSIVSDRSMSPDAEMLR